MLQPILDVLLKYAQELILLLIAAILGFASLQIRNGLLAFRDAGQAYKLKAAQTPSLLDDGAAVVWITIADALLFRFGTGKPVELPQLKK